MNLDDKTLKKILLQQNYVSESDIAGAEQFVKQNNGTLLDYLYLEKVLTKNILGQAIAEYYGTVYSDLSIKKPTVEHVLKIPEEIAKQYHLIFVEEEDQKILISSDRPDQIKLFADKLTDLFPKKKIRISFSFKEDIESAFNFYKKPLHTRFTEIIQKDIKIAPEIIAEIVKDAINLRASDIHIEPQDHEVVLRFRIDGMLQEAGRFQKDVYQNILNRIKVAAHIRIDEHYSAQDGAIRFETEKNPVDLRISIVPTLDGEKIVVRILSQYVKNFTLGDLGLSSVHQNLLLNAARKPFGMILTTGPTGSGKTTTLYSLLKVLNNPQSNITTIEDPVEYRVPGINQIQVNNQTNLTFAQGLRSIVRQDPNIILVGEIRDMETAEIAVNAALTGHLLLSTFHANDAATAVPRLFDMGIEPFLLASTLNLIIAQRLARKICENCRYSKVISYDDLKEHIPNPKKYFPKEPITVYEGKGCDICNGTGYKGRVALFEMIYVTPEIQELILQKPSMAQIWEVALTQGSKSFFDDGIDKINNGITSVAELIRVAPPIFDMSRIYGDKK